MEEGKRLGLIWNKMFAFFIAEGGRQMLSKKVQEGEGVNTQPAGSHVRRWPPCPAFANKFLNEGELSHLTQISHKHFAKPFSLSGHL